jgi:dsRNA-specific ribonuclease
MSQAFIHIQYAEHKFLNRLVHQTNITENTTKLYQQCFAHPSSMHAIEAIFIQTTM